MQRVTMFRVYTGWLQYHQQEKHMVSVEKRLLSKIFNRTLSFAMERWTTYVHERQFARGMWTRWAARIENEDLSWGFTYWRRYVGSELRGLGRGWVLLGLRVGAEGLRSRVLLHPGK